MPVWDREKIQALLHLDAAKPDHWLMSPITGDTYEIREQLKALKCHWDEDQQCWQAPDEGARAQGQALADAEPWRKWRGHCETLEWVQGAFTKSVWEAGLNACSRGIPMGAAIEEIRARIAATGKEAEAGWLERNVGRAYEKAEPPREARGGLSGSAPGGGRVQGTGWPQVWREEMKWTGTVAVGVTWVGGIPVTGELAYCSRYAQQFFGVSEGAAVSEERWQEIKRLDAHLFRLRDREEEGAPAAPSKPEFEESLLAKFAGPWAKAVDALWLSDRSPVEPVGTTADGFLRSLYGPGERVVVLDVFASQGQWLWSHEQGFESSRVDSREWERIDREHAAAPPTRDGVRFEGAGPQGVWYLCNPVDGVFRTIAERDKWGRPKWSRRWEGCVTAWRYLVLESDEADPREWMGAIVQLPLPIAAIYTSGGKSVHVLVRVDARSKAHFDTMRETAKRTMIPLGADAQCISAVRLTRLPACLREQDKEGRAWAQGPRQQKLLYLDAEPSGVPLVDRAPVRDSLGGFERLVRSIVDSPRSEEDAPVDVEGIVRGLRQFRCERARGLIEEMRRWQG